MEVVGNRWTMCEECKGRGKRSRRIRKKARLQYLRELDQFEKSNGEGVIPVRPKGHQYPCANCSGSGLVSTSNFPVPDKDNYPHVAIIGGGIGGVALAVACLHRGIPFTLYERDTSFNARSQGYGLTLQQASKAIDGFGIFSLKEGVVSTRHIVHTTEGKVIGEWGMRKWMASDTEKSPKNTNVHIARQSLRLALLEQLGGMEKVHWGHQLLSYKKCESGKVSLSFEVDGDLKKTQADLVVGADGIRSTMRKMLIGESVTPLHYLGCMVILGICPLTDIDDDDSSLLDSATVFQTANGHERIYIMPFTNDSIMWQLSFPFSEEEAIALNKKGIKSLKKEATQRTQWHSPIPQIIAATLESQISGYPVYDREILTPALLQNEEQITLIGDAAHPMSPFKGQGANQALLDALALARGITSGCRPSSQWREAGIRKYVLNDFEAEMIERTTPKVKDSAAAAIFLHSEAVLFEADEPRGRCLKRRVSD